MRTRWNPTGSVLLVVVVLVALLAATVMGHLQVNAEEIQLMQNHLRGAEALCLAEAGLNDALAQLRTDPTWTSGFTDKPFNNGTYTVTIEDSTITAVGTTSSGFMARMRAEVTVAYAGPPYIVRIEELRINP